MGPLHYAARRARLRIAVAGVLLGFACTSSAEAPALPEPYPAPEHAHIMGLRIGMPVARIEPAANAAAAAQARAFDPAASDAHARVACREKRTEDDTYLYIPPHSGECIVEIRATVSGTEHVVVQHNVQFYGDYEGRRLITSMRTTLPRISSHLMRDIEASLLDRFGQPTLAAHESPYSDVHQYHMVWLFSEAHGAQHSADPPRFGEIDTFGCRDSSMEIAKGSHIERTIMSIEQDNANDAAQGYCYPRIIATLSFLHPPGSPESIADLADLPVAELSVALSDGEYARALRAFAVPQEIERQQALIGLREAAAQDARRERAAAATPPDLGF